MKLPIASFIGLYIFIFISSCVDKKEKIVSQVLKTAKVELVSNNGNPVSINWLSPPDSSSKPFEAPTISSNNIAVNFIYKRDIIIEDTTVFRPGGTVEVCTQMELRPGEFWNGEFSDGAYTFQIGEQDAWDNTRPKQEINRASTATHSLASTNRSNICVIENNCLRSDDVTCYDLRDNGIYIENSASEYIVYKLLD